MLHTFDLSKVAARHAAQPYVGMVRYVIVENEVIIDKGNSRFDRGRQYRVVWKKHLGRDNGQEYEEKKNKFSQQIRQETELRLIPNPFPFQRSTSEENWTIDPRRIWMWRRHRDHSAVNNVNLMALVQTSAWSTGPALWLANRTEEPLSWLLIFHFWPQTLSGQSTASNWRSFSPQNLLLRHPKISLSTDRCRRGEMSTVF